MGACRICLHIEIYIEQNIHLMSATNNSACYSLGIVFNCLTMKHLKTIKIMRTFIPFSNMEYFFGGTFFWNSPVFMRNMLSKKLYTNITYNICSLAQRVKFIKIEQLDLSVSLILLLQVHIYIATFVYWVFSIQ